MSPTRAAVNPLATTIPGQLAWGQSGNYNAVDDRAVIGALFAGGRAAGGLVIAPTFTAQAGLTMAVGPWAAIVDCGDGTRAVISSRVTANIDIAAGGSSARADVLWADINPDAASYTVSLIAESAVAGRAGVFLGLVLVPASANTAAAMDLRPGSARLLGAQKATFPNLNCSGSNWTQMAQMVIPAYDAEVGAVYQIEVWGNGVQGSPRNTQAWRPTLGGQQLTQVTFGTIAWSATSVAYRGMVRARVICQSTGPGGLWVSFIEASTTENGNAIAPGNNNFANAMCCEATGTYTQDTTRDAIFGVQTQFPTTGFGTGATYNSRVAIAQRVA